jgi:hypothetical protein
MTVVRSSVALMVALILLLGATNPVFAQVSDAEQDADVEVEFLEQGVVLEWGKNVTTPLRVTAELQCAPGYTPPDSGIKLRGVYGVSLHSSDGYVYRSQPVPPEVMFTDEGDGRFVIDEEVDMLFTSEVPVNSTRDFEVYYSTNGYGSGDSCTPLGWRANMAESTGIHLRVLPPPEESASEEDTEAQESPLIAPMVLLLVAAVVMQAARASRRR